MQKLAFALVFILSFYSGLAQNSEVLADSYYKRGEFKKALIIYQNLLKEKPYNSDYIYKVVDTHQQLEQYDEAEDLLVQRLSTTRRPTLLVELGYNYQLKDSLKMADSIYKEAIAFIDERPIYIYSIAKKI
jgi:tetratricopeptide (TPR) repeat protein